MDSEPPSFRLKFGRHGSLQQGKGEACQFRVQVHSSFWLRLYCSSSFGACLVSVFSGLIWKGEKNMNEMWSPLEMTRLWTLGLDRQLDLKVWLAPLLGTYSYIQKNIAYPVIATADKHTKTGRTQILKAGIWVQGRPLAESAAWDESFDPYLALPSPGTVMIYIPCTLAVRIQLDNMD